MEKDRPERKNILKKSDINMLGLMFRSFFGKCDDYCVYLYRI